MVVIENIEKTGKSSMNMESYEFKNKRRIYLLGEINDDMAMEIIRQINYLNDISQDDITLVINSPGGHVNAGLAIYDVMKNSKAKIATVCLGMAASMAAVLLAAGEKGKRSAYPHSEVMIHQVMGGMQGQATDMGIAYKRIEKKKHLLNTILSEHTGQPYEQVASDTERDYYMMSKEALEYGMIDFIEEGGES